MNKQPTFQAHQSVKVTGDHKRAGQAGVVVDVNERDAVIKPATKTAAEVTATCVGVQFDVDGAIEQVPVSALSALK